MTRSRFPRKKSRATRFYQNAQTALVITAALGADEGKPSSQGREPTRGTHHTGSPPSLGASSSRCRSLALMLLVGELALLRHVPSRSTSASASPTTRLLTNRGYRTPKGVEYFVTMCGCLALEGRNRSLGRHHRVTIKNSDHEGDPHLPSHDGHWWANGWHGFSSGRALHSETALWAVMLLTSTATTCPCMASSK